MSEQANTAENVDVNPKQMDQDTRLAPDTQKQGEAYPQDDANQTSEQAVEPTEDDIQKAEKRANDKKAYLEKLQAELADYDREINKKNEALKMAQSNQNANISHDNSMDNLSEDHQQAARSLGLTGNQFIDFLKEDPDKAVAAIVKASTANAMMQLERSKFEADINAKLQNIHQTLGDDGYGHLNQLVMQYKTQGFLPTPEQAMNEVMYGTPEQQRKLMEYGKIMLQQQNEQKQTQQPVPEPKDFKMAPGGGNPLYAGQNKPKHQDRGNLLSSMGWNV